MTFLRFRSSLYSHAVLLPLLLGLTGAGCGTAVTASDAAVGDAAVADAVAADTALPDAFSNVDAGPVPDVCARTTAVTTSDGDPVLRCDELFPARPFVHLPPARTSGDIETLYAAFSLDEGIVLPNGDALVAVDGAGAPLSFEATTWPARLHFPSSRVLVYVYELTGHRTTVMVGAEVLPAFRVDEGRPFVLLAADVIDGFALGPWEGTIAGQRDVPDGINVYDLENGAHFRAEYGSLEALSDGLIEWSGTTSFPEGGRSTVHGTIVNVMTSVRGADGTCIAALSSSPRIPLTGVTDARLDMTRIAAMHAPGDMVLAHEYPTGFVGGAGGGMSPLHVLHPAAFIQDAERDLWTLYAPWPHGTPTGMRLEMRRVSGGGGPCP